MGRVFYAVSHATLGRLIRGTWRVWAEGVEHVPLEGGAILASNHLSFLDHFVMPPVLRRQVYFISKHQHFESPVKRYFFRNWGVIPLKRGEGDTEAFDRSADIIRAGNLFCIYPEGTRSLDGRLHKGHTGVARLALRTGAPVIPVAMFGTFDAMPKGKSVPGLDRCGVRFGAPMDFSAYRAAYDDRKRLRQITDAIMREIGHLSRQEYVHEYQSNPEIPRADHGGAARAATASGSGTRRKEAVPGAEAAVPRRTGSPATRRKATGGA